MSTKDLLQVDIDFQLHQAQQQNQVLYHQKTIPYRQQPDHNMPHPASTNKLQHERQCPTLQGPRYFYLRWKPFMIDEGDGRCMTTTNLVDCAHPNTALQWIASGLKVYCIDTAEYAFKVDDGFCICLMLPSVLYISKLPVHLFPRHVAEIAEYEGDGFNSTSPTGIFTCCRNRFTMS